jgi:hypothetical protein
MSHPTVANHMTTEVWVKLSDNNTVCHDQIGVDMEITSRITINGHRMGE